MKVQKPPWQIWLDWHAWQVLPEAPQAVEKSPDWQVPAASQHPAAQVEALQSFFGSPQDGASAMNHPSTRPEISHLRFFMESLLADAC